MTEDGAAALLADVRHAAGNLVHRMHYWATLLGDGAAGADRAEAVAELRSSIDGLHDLIGQTMELLRPARVRAISLPAADLIRAVAMRFDARCDDALDAARDAVAEACIDPALLERALAIVTEVAMPALAAEDSGSVRRPGATLAVVEGDAQGRALAVVVARAQPSPRDAHASVRAEVSLALAAKLLDDTGCTLSVAAGELRLSIPLRVPTLTGAAFA